ncbi:MAG: hypothetical protein ABIZ07_14495, partial [Dermatophilaceae bacterium]
DVKTGRERVRCDVGADAGWAVAISPDGRGALSVHDSDVILWNLASAQELHRFQGHSNQIMALAFAPDGRTALSSSQDGSIRLWGVPPETERTPVVAQRGEHPAREAVAQEKPRQAKVGDPESPEHAPEPTKFETVKLDDGTEIQVEKWGKTYPAYDYHPPVDILDRRVHVVLDCQRDGEPRNPVSSLEVDSKGGWLYWCDGTSNYLGGRVMRAHLDGGGVQALATGRLYPHSLVLDRRRGRLYWLEGAGDDPGRLQAATIDGKETTLSKGLNRPGGLALDSARGQLYYWEQSRLVRINVDGAEEKILMANPRARNVNFNSLAFDVAHDRLIGSAGGGQYQWLDRDNPHLLQYVPRMEPWARIYGLAFDEDHQKVYFANLRQALQRSNMDGTQIETLVASPAECPDGCSRQIFGAVALDPARGHIYWTGLRTRGSAMYPTISRTALRPLPEPAERPAPPRVRAIEPPEQRAGGEVVLSGDGLVGTVDVRFIDDSTGAHVEAKFREAAQGRLLVAVPRLGDRCRRPVVVIRTPGGVTMTLGTDTIVPDNQHYPYEDVGSIDLDKEPPWWMGTNMPYQHERSEAGPGARVWLRPGLMAGNIETAVVYAQHGSNLGFGSKGMATAFAKDDSYVGVGDGLYDDVVVYHEPFTGISWRSYYNTTVKWIPVPAIRPSFPKQSFRYRID